FRAVSRETAMRRQGCGRYSYTMETIVQAGWQGMRVVGVPIRVNAATRESRLVKSIPQYVWRSGSTIVRSFALYKPFRFFVLLSVLPFLGGAALVVRWFVLTTFGSGTATRVPGLVAAAVLLILAVLLCAVGMLADLLSANRRMLGEVRLSLRRAELEGRHDG
ncbi:MAG: glycosyltransferase family 2 protein, partial [Actinomycetes bacterium]